MASGTGRPVRVRSRGASRVRAGHPWIFADDVEDRRGAEHGDLVRVEGPGGAVLGTALHSSRSKIALRLVARGDLRVDDAFWRDRVDAAIERRPRAKVDRGACRLVFGESDGIPGLVADRYADLLVVQALTAGTERLLPGLLDRLVERTGVMAVLARNDPSVRSLEGLPREVRALRGDPPELVEIEEDGVIFGIDPWHGQKTGAFLDQRENRAAASRLSRGRVLDAFAYHGSFGMQMARTADEVVVVDASAEAIARARWHAERNGLSSVTTVEANVFDDLRDRERRGERFDVIVLDPPAFAKSRGDVPAARRGYKEINLRALRILAPGGHLVTSSCSYHLDEVAFEELLAAAAADLSLELRIVLRLGQSSDHPVRLGFPESRYLKCLVLERGRASA